MGRRGPAARPTNLKLLQGDKPSRINTNEPVPRQALPECPAEVSPKVRDVWDYTLTELAAMRTIKAADRDTLLCYCEAVVLHNDASALLAKTTILVKGALGGLVRNPAIAVQRDAAQRIRAFAQEFGLTPSARSGIVVGGAHRKPGEDLLTG